MLDHYFKRLKWDNTSIFMTLVKVFYYNVCKINRFVIFELHLGQEIRAQGLDPFDFTLKILSYKELEKLIPIQKLKPREYWMYQADGVKNCVVVLHGDQIAHISWIYMQGDKNRWFNLKEKQAHLNYSITDPQFRGKNLFPEALLHAARWLKSNEYETIIMDVHEDTKFMLRSMEKIREVKKIGVLSQWFIYRPKYKYNAAA